MPLSESFPFDWVIHSSTVCFVGFFFNGLFMWPFCNICIFTTIRAAFTLPEVDAHSCMCLQMLTRGNDDFTPRQHDAFTAGGSTEMVLQNVLMGSY